MKEFNLLTGTIVQRAIESLKNELPNMTTNELVTFTMLFTSQSIQQHLPHDALIGDKLDYYLTKNLEIMTPNEFAYVCNT